MQGRRRFLPTLLILLVIAIVIYALSSFGLLSGARGFFERAFAPWQRAVFGLAVGGDSDNDKLRTENLMLAAQIVDQSKNKREIETLRAQFDAWDGATTDLLPANIIGRTGGYLIIDTGADAGVKKNQAVVMENNLVGILDEVSSHVSRVRLITDDEMSFTAETVENGSIGVVKGTGNGLILDNVVLTDKLEEDSLVVTRGDVGNDGGGLMPGLVVGRIESVNREESALFQSADIKSFVDFGRVKKVFVITTSN